jgi:Family of unknown function (DUF5317)
LDDYNMLTVYICAAALLALVVTGGRIRRLAEIRLQHTWLLYAALVTQIVIVSVIPGSRPALLSSAHVASYLAAGGFLLANRHLPGVWLVGAGGALNGVVITINGGTLPASATALHASGAGSSTGQFNNSGVLPNPHLPMLGDVFATPSWLPVHNVFSLGDIAIWLGVIWFLWRICRPEPTPNQGTRYAGKPQLRADPTQSAHPPRRKPAYRYSPGLPIFQLAGTRRRHRPDAIGRHRR